MPEIAPVDPFALDAGGAAPAAPRPADTGTARELLGLLAPHMNIIDWINYAARKTSGDLLFPGERVARAKMDRAYQDERLTKSNWERDSENWLRPQPYEGQYR